MCGKFSKIGKNPLTLVGNMDETPVFFDLASNKSFGKERSKSTNLRASNYEKNTWQLL